MASAGSGDPCTPAAKAGLKVSDPAGGGALYATHELVVTALGTGEDTFLNSQTASAPGARRVSDPESSDPPRFARDTPGPLTVSGVVDTTDPSRPADDPGCSANVSTTVQLRPALTPLVSLKRPRRGRDGRRRLIYPDPPVFTMTLRHRTGSNRLPITVRARVTRRLRLPGKGAKAASEVFAQRASDSVESPDSRRCELICSPLGARGFRKATSVEASAIESARLFSNGLRVRLLPPTGYPASRRSHRVRNPPFGADIELLQAGRRLARLRVVGRCIGSGQSSRCRFRRISTKR